jgi:hypothetical protein
MSMSTRKTPPTTIVGNRPSKHTRGAAVLAEGFHLLQQQVNDLHQQQHELQAARKRLTDARRQLRSQRKHALQFALLVVSWAQMLLKREQALEAREIALREKEEAIAKREAVVASTELAALGVAEDTVPPNDQEERSKPEQDWSAVDTILADLRNHPPRSLLPLAPATDGARPASSSAGRDSLITHEQGAHHTPGKDTAAHAGQTESLSAKSHPNLTLVPPVPAVQFPSAASVSSQSDSQPLLAGRHQLITPVWLAQRIGNRPAIAWRLRDALGSIRAEAVAQMDALLQPSYWLRMPLTPAQLTEYWSWFDRYAEAVLALVALDAWIAALRLQKKGYHVLWPTTWTDEVIVQAPDEQAEWRISASDLVLFDLPMQRTAALAQSFADRAARHAA